MSDPSTEDLKAFGERLRTSRKRLGLTQGQLAELIPTDSGTVSRWERGEGYPQTQQLVRLSQVLGESIDYLVLGPSDSRTPVVMPEAFIAFLQTELGRIAQQRGYVPTLLTVRTSGVPTIRFYSAIVAGLLTGTDE